MCRLFLKLYYFYPKEIMTRDMSWNGDQTNAQPIELAFTASHLTIIKYRDT